MNNETNGSGSNNLELNQFAARIIEGLKENSRFTNIQYLPEKSEIHCRTNEDHPLRLHLGNAFDEYHTAFECNKERIINHWVSAWTTIPNEIKALPTLKELQKHLLPVVRARVAYEVEALDKNRAMRPFKMLADGLAVGLACDYPNAMCHVTKDMLDSVNLDFKTALDYAVRNLRMMTPLFLREASPGFFVSPWDDCYDASRILLTDKIRKLKLDGDPVAVIPNRSELIVVGSNDLRGMKRALKCSEAESDRSRHLGGMPLRLDISNDWVPFTPSDPSLAAAVNRHAIEFLCRSYQAQGSALRDSGTSPFAASVMMVNAQNEQSTLSVWSKGVRTLLPKTDLICLSDDKNPAAVVDNVYKWDDMVCVLGSMMEPQNLWPERFLVNSFPSAQEISQLQPIHFEKPNP